MLRDELDDGAVEPVRHAEHGVVLGRHAKFLVAVLQRELGAFLAGECLEPLRQAVVQRLLGIGMSERVEPRRTHEMVCDAPREHVRDAG